MKQYVITALLNHTDVPMFKRGEIPLHLTLAGPFFSDREFGELAEKMRLASSETKPLTLRGTARRMFGRDKNIPGTLIERTPELYALHNRLFDEMKGMVTIKIPEHNRQAYTPHVSDRPTGKIEVGHTFTIDSMSLLEFVDDTIVILATEHMV